MGDIKKKERDLVDRLHELSAIGRTSALRELAREAADAIDALRGTSEQQAAQEATAAVAGQMREYLEQDVEPGFDVIERWAKMLLAQPPGRV